MVKQKSPEPTSAPPGVSVRGNEYGGPPLDAEVDALGVQEVQGLPAWVRWINRLATASVVVGGVACFVMMVQVVADVVARTLWNPLPLTLEMSQHWWMVAIVFTGFGYTQLRRENIRATIITEHLSSAWRRAADLGAEVLLGGFAVAMAFYGWFAAMDSLEIRETVVATHDIPIWPFAFLVPFGWAVLVLQCVATLYETATGVSRESHAEELI